jgi:glucosylceramidase
MRNVAYYVTAHAARFVRPGSVRVHSAELASVPNVAFRTPAGQIVLIALNDSDRPVSFVIRYRRRQAAAMLPAGSVATLVWQAS